MVEGRRGFLRKLLGLVGITAIPAALVAEHVITSSWSVVALEPEAAKWIQTAKMHIQFTWDDEKIGGGEVFGDRPPLRFDCQEESTAAPLFRPGSVEIG